MIKYLTNELDLVNQMTDYKLTLNSFSKCLVYYENDQIIAFLDYSVMYEKGEINYIYVSDKYLRKGIASELLSYMISEEQLENITLEVNVNNKKALNLYHKFGFKTVAKRNKYYGSEDAYLMEKVI